MWDQNPNSMSSNAGAHAQASETDQGLRSFMLSVYNYMASALLVTGVVAYLTSAMSVTEVDGQLMLTELGNTLFNSPLQWLVMLAPLGFIFFLSFKITSLSFSKAQGIFWAFSVVMGLSMASIFLVYTGESIARMFFITAAAFGALSLWGYTTKRNLQPMGAFLFMGLIGIILASLVNIFVGSSQLELVISVIGVLIFAGLTAYDTQKLKATYYQLQGTGETLAKAGLMGALSLYLDFINLFMMLLRLFGDRR